MRPLTLLLSSTIISTAFFSSIGFAITSGNTIAEPRIKRGVNMQTVFKTFGEPTQRRAPIGDPAITRWEYPDFQVVFEKNLVIDTVEKR